MLERIIDFSLRNRGAVIAAWALVAFTGLLSFLSLPLDAFPDTTPPQVQVHAVAETLAPLEVEKLITFPLEQALTNLPGIEDVRSLSKFGFSQITLQFEDGTDVYFARQQVSERHASVELPAGVARPTLGPVASGLGEVFHYVVRGDGVPLEELRTIHDRVIAPQLRTVPGVAEVNAWGGAEKQWHVVVDPRRLQQFDLSLGDVYEALERNNANVGGGIIEAGGSSKLVLGIGRLPDGAALGKVTIAARAGVPIRVEDVATVEVGREIRRGAVTEGGR
jgi:cobalt-zinc-cadmium resistance protein CzcA